MKGIQIVIVIFLLGSISVAQAQTHQLVVLKRDRILARFYEGDMMRFAIYPEKKFRYDRIVAFTDTTIITTQDTILYYTLSKIDLRNKLDGGLNLKVIGTTLITAGIILPLGDWINVDLIQNDDYSFDRGIGTTSAVLIGTGAAMIALNKSHITLYGRKKVKIVDKNSLLYKEQFVPDKGYISPYIPRN